MMVSRAATLESANGDAPPGRADRKEGHAPGEKILPTAVQSADSHGDLAMPTWARRRHATRQDGSGLSYRLQDLLTSQGARIAPECHHELPPLGEVQLATLFYARSSLRSDPGGSLFGTLEGSATVSSWLVSGFTATGKRLLSASHTKRSVSACPTVQVVLKIGEAMGVKARHSASAQRPTKAWILSLVALSLNFPIWAMTSPVSSPSPLLEPSLQKCPVIRAPACVG
jgi:hypothetical protein